MHRLFQRGKFRSQVINVPEGLPELLSDIAREVLRCQPTTECLCQFIIDYLHSVINTRDKAIIAKSIIDRALRIVDDVIADLCICDIPREKSDYMSQTMEECFRRFLEQRRCEKTKNKEMIKFDDFDMLNELVKKCKFTDSELKISKPVIELAYKKFVNAYLTAKESADGTDYLYQYFQKREIARLEQRLINEAAIKIQRNYRGYIVRKSMFSNQPIQYGPTPPSQTEVDQNQLNLAALKIQRFFRRHKSLLKSVDIHRPEEISSQDACRPDSNISLTARPANHHDVHDANYEAEENQTQSQNEKQIELLAENLKDNKELDSTINETGEDDAEEDFSNEDMAEDLQNDYSEL